MKKEFKRVLITGTTSGLGKALQAYYGELGAEVIAVNRRKSYEVSQWQVEEHVIDITNYEAVYSFLRDLKGANRLPDLLILSAGINRPDNLNGLQYQVFSEVMKTNVDGVMTFIGALHELNVEDKVISVMSSTSNIVPNPSHLSYYLSKLALHEATKCLRQKDTKNCYKSVILSPVLTGIMAGYPKPQGLQGKIFDILAVPSDEAAKACAKFFSGTQETFYYTKVGCLFYFAVSFLLKFLPGLYQGTGQARHLARE